MYIRTLRKTDFTKIRILAETARSEGFKFLDRFVRDVDTGSVTIDAPGECFICVVDNANIIGIGGITPDPYSNQQGVGRIRHVYVHPDHRRKGIGRTLIREIEDRASRIYNVLRLRTDTPDGARFYEALGYSAVSDPTATHVRATLPSTSDNQQRTRNNL